MAPAVREATHAGSWYKGDRASLRNDLDRYLSQVPQSLTGITTSSSGNTWQQSPVAGARVIIAPHAGYRYSGPAAAWAYKAWDCSKAKRVFLLGPSHHHYTRKALVSACGIYNTPLGDLRVDQATLAELANRDGFDGYMSESVDENEHSLEMHLPYIWRMLAEVHSSNTVNMPPLVPIMIGNTNPETERSIGQALAPYLADPENAFVISSDFCHWGLRFDYTRYYSNDGTRHDLRRNSPRPRAPKIFESIDAIDRDCMEAVESGSHKKFLERLEVTGNTVCGRHPIGVIMAAIEHLERSSTTEPARFKFVRYERNEDITDVSESSVSYCSAFAVVTLK